MTMSFLIEHCSFLRGRKEQEPRSRKKFSFFTKVTECFSGYFDLTIDSCGGPFLSKATFNVPTSHGSQVIGPEKSLPWYDP